MAACAFRDASLSPRQGSPRVRNHTFWAAKRMLSHGKRYGFAGQNVWYCFAPLYVLWERACSYAVRLWMAMVDKG